jgi:hypothetical protein
VLHDIRLVTSWPRRALTAAPARRAAEWQTRLIAKAIRIPGRSRSTSTALSRLTSP